MILALRKPSQKRRAEAAHNQLRTALSVLQELSTSDPQFIDVRTLEKDKATLAGVISVVREPVPVAGKWEEFYL